MNKDGITLEAKEITVKGTEKVTVKAGDKLDMEGGEYVLNAGKGQGSVKASTIVEVKGAQVKINC